MLAAWRGDLSRPPGFRNRLLSSQKRNVHVGAEARVIRQIPAHMIGIVVDHDTVAVPIPVIDIGIIEIRNSEVKAVEPEAFSVSAAQYPHVPRTEPAAEPAMLPWMVNVKTPIVGIVSDPAIIPVNMRSVRMAFAVAPARFVMLHPSAFRPSRWNVLAPVMSPITIMAVAVAIAVPVMVLGHHGHRKNERKRQKPVEDFLHD